MVSILAATRWRGSQSAAATPIALLMIGGLLTSPAEASLVKDARQAMSENRFEDAVTAYDQLAREFRDREEGFRFSLAMGNAAYRQGDWATARKAFSEALRSTDSVTREAAHHGMGNTLFQIGWERLSGGKAYPEIAQTTDEGNESSAFDQLSDALLEKSNQPPENQMERFEAMVKKRLGEWMKENTEASSQSRGAQRFNKLLSDWIDSTHHHRDARQLSEASHNREVTASYLEKLYEILNQTQENAQQIRALPETGEGDRPKDEGEDGDQESDEEGRDSDESGEQGPDGQQNSGGEGESDNEEEQNSDGKTPEAEEASADTETKAGETPEDAARRILNENSDLQKGALSPGRRRFQRPDKDW